MKIITIGRSSSNDVNIDDPLVSRSHCQIIQDDNGRFRLLDTNSTNGTFINGTQRHGEVSLNKADIVRIGNTTLPWQTYFTGTGIGLGSTDIRPDPISKPNNFLVWAILGTIFCCVPFGIVSIIYASKVDGLWGAGKHADAQAAAQKARTWFWWGFGAGLICQIVYLVFYVLAEVL